MLRAHSDKVTKGPKQRENERAIPMPWEDIKDRGKHKGPETEPGCLVNVSDTKVYGESTLSKGH